MITFPHTFYGGGKKRKRMTRHPDLTSRERKLGIGARRNENVRGSLRLKEIPLGEGRPMPMLYLEKREKRRKSAFRYIERRDVFRPRQRPGQCTPSVGKRRKEMRFCRRGKKGKKGEKVKN